jgi:hypothetical protein
MQNATDGPQADKKMPQIGVFTLDYEQFIVTT